MRSKRYLFAVLKLYAFLFQQGDAAVDDGLVELEVRNAIAEQSASSLVLLEYCYLIAHQVQVVGNCQSSRTSTDHCHRLAVSFYVCLWLYEALAEGTLNDGALVLTVGSGLVVEAVQNACLFAKGRTDAAGELREGIRGGQQFEGQFPVTLVQGIIPFWSFIAQRTCPVAEGNAAVHAA